MLAKVVQWELSSPIQRDRLLVWFFFFFSYQYKIKECTVATCVNPSASSIQASVAGAMLFSTNKMWDLLRYAPRFICITVLPIQFAYSPKKFSSSSLWKLLRSGTILLHYVFVVSFLVYSNATTITKRGDKECWQFELLRVLITSGMMSQISEK